MTATGLAVPDLQLLEGDLAEECLEFDALIHALEREHAAIAAGLADELTQLAAEKERRMESIAGFAARRRDLLDAAGHADGMRGLLRSLGAGHRLHTAWRRVQARASKAEQLNRSSGILLRLHAAQLAARIAAFMSAAAPAATYSAGGMFALSGHRALGAA